MALPTVVLFDQSGIHKEPVKKNYESRESSRMDLRRFARFVVFSSHPDRPRQKVFECLRIDL